MLFKLLNIVFIIALVVGIGAMLMKVFKTKSKNKTGCGSNSNVRDNDGKCTCSEGKYPIYLNSNDKSLGISVNHCMECNPNDLEDYQGTQVCTHFSNGVRADVETLKYSHIDPDVYTEEQYNSIQEELCAQDNPEITEKETNYGNVCGCWGSVDADNKPTTYPKYNPNFAEDGFKYSCAPCPPGTVGGLLEQNGVWQTCVVHDQNEACEGTFNATAFVRQIEPSQPYSELYVECEGGSGHSNEFISYQQNMKTQFENSNDVVCSGAANNPPCYDSVSGIGYNLDENGNQIFGCWQFGFDESTVEGVGDSDTPGILLNYPVFDYINNIYVCKKCPAGMVGIVNELTGGDIEQTCYLSNSNICYTAPHFRAAYPVVVSNGPFQEIGITCNGPGTNSQEWIQLQLRFQELALEQSGNVSADSVSGVFSYNIDNSMYGCWDGTTIPEHIPGPDNMYRCSSCPPGYISSTEYLDQDLWQVCILDSAEAACPGGVVPELIADDYPYAPLELSCGEGIEAEEEEEDEIEDEEEIEDEDPIEDPPLVGDGAEPVPALTGLGSNGWYCLTNEPECSDYAGALSDEGKHLVAIYDQYLSFNYFQDLNFNNDMVPLRAIKKFGLPIYELEVERNCSSLDLKDGSLFNQKLELGELVSENVDYCITGDRMTETVRLSAPNNNSDSPALFWKLDDDIMVHTLSLSRLPYTKNDLHDGFPDTFVDCEDEQTLVTVYGPTYDAFYNICDMDLLGPQLNFNLIKPWEEVKQLYPSFYKNINVVQYFYPPISEESVMRYTYFLDEDKLLDFEMKKVERMVNENPEPIKSGLLFGYQWYYDKNDWFQFRFPPAGASVEKFIVEEENPPPYYAREPERELQIPWWMIEWPPPDQDAAKQIVAATDLYIKLPQDALEREDGGRTHFMCPGGYKWAVTAQKPGEPSKRVMLGLVATNMMSESDMFNLNIPAVPSPQARADIEGVKPIVEMKVPVFDTLSLETGQWRLVDWPPLAEEDEQYDCPIEEGVDDGGIYDIIEAHGEQTFYDDYSEIYICGSRGRSSGERDVIFRKDCFTGEDFMNEYNEEWQEFYYEEGCERHAFTDLERGLHYSFNVTPAIEGENLIAPNAGAGLVWRVNLCASEENAPQLEGMEDIPLVNDFDESREYPFRICAYPPRSGTTDDVPYVTQTDCYSGDQLVGPDGIGGTVIYDEDEYGEPRFTEYQEMATDTGQSAPMNQGGQMIYLITKFEEEEEEVDPNRPTMGDYVKLMEGATIKANILDDGAYGLVVRYDDDTALPFMVESLIAKDDKGNLLQTWVGEDKLEKVSEDVALAWLDEQLAEQESNAIQVGSFVSFLKHGGNNPTQPPGLDKLLAHRRYRGCGSIGKVTEIVEGKEFNIRVETLDGCKIDGVDNARFREIDLVGGQDPNTVSVDKKGRGRKKNVPQPYFYREGGGRGGQSLINSIRPYREIRGNAKGQMLVVA